MGNFCATDIYKQVKDKYKTEFVKLIITENSIKVLDSLVQKSKKQFQQKLNEVKVQKIKAIEHSSTQITQNFFQSRKILEQSTPGGIKSIQKLKKGKIQQLMGYTYYQEKISDLKQQTSQKIDNLQKQLLIEINSIYKYYRNKFVQDQPDLVLFNQLNPQVKKDVFSKGFQQYKQQIQKSQNQLKRSLGDKLDSDSYVDRMRHILPQQSLDGLVSLAKEKFQNTVQILSSGTLKQANKIF